MNIYDRSVRVSIGLIATALLVVFLIISIYIYCKADNQDGKMVGLAGNLIAGLIIAILQFGLGWLEYVQTKELKKLKLLEILYTRSERIKYEKFIRSAKRNLDVMGVTTSRFFNDFADTDTAAPDEAKVLLYAMDKGVKVRLLIPSDEYLPNDTKREDAKRVKFKYEELKKKYPHNLEIRYFNHTAAHSIFRVDDTCIIGPVFPELESKYTPALHVMNSSPMALNYMDYFESEWNQAIQGHA